MVPKEEEQSEIVKIPAVPQIFPAAICGGTQLRQRCVEKAFLTESVGFGRIDDGRMLFVCSPTIWRSGARAGDVWATHGAYSADAYRNSSRYSDPEEQKYQSICVTPNGVGLETRGGYVKTNPDLRLPHTMVV